MLPAHPPSSPQPPVKRRRPVRGLLLLTVGVVLAHWALLHSAPLNLASHASPDSPSDLPFITRTITVPAAPPPVPPAATAAARAHAAPAPAPASPSSRLVTEPDAAPPADDTTPAAAQTEVDHTDAVDVAAAQVPPPGAPKAPAAQAVHSYAIPGSMQLPYDIRGETRGVPFSLNGNLNWQQDGSTYNARMEVSHFLLGARIQTSTGELTAHGLEPTRFGDKFRSEVAAHFERAKNKITFSANTPDAPLLPGAQDQLSVLIQLAAMLGGAPRDFPEGSQLTFQAVGPRSSETWIFTVGALEKLTLPNMELNALKLWRNPSSEYGSKAEVWLAPGLAYMPVRIRITEANGDVADQRWLGDHLPQY